MYGIRLAPSNWNNCYSNLLFGNGLTRARGSTCVFYNTCKYIDLIVQGDDFVTAGNSEDFLWLQKLFEKTFLISTTIIGHDARDGKAVKVLNWIINIADDAYICS